MHNKIFDPKKLNSFLIHSKKMNYEYLFVQDILEYLM